MLVWRDHKPRPSGPKYQEGILDKASDEPTAAFLAHPESDGRSQLLRDHLSGVSRGTQSHADKIGIGPAGAAIGLLHDLGKYSNAFQQYLRRMALSQDTEQPDPERGRIDHSTAGAQLIWHSLKPVGTRNHRGNAGNLRRVQSFRIDRWRCSPRARATIRRSTPKLA